MSRIWTPGQVQNLIKDGRAGWYRIANQAGADGATEVSIYDSIGDWGVSARDFLHELAAVQGPVNLHLNSEGGEVFDGLAIYDALKRRGNVTVYVDSLAASISSVIAQAGVKRVMAKNATMMIHDASTMAMGNAGDMRTMADLLDKTSDNLASVYAERSGSGDTASWRDAMRATTWYSADEAVSAGLADEVAGAAPVVKAGADQVTADPERETIVAGTLPFRLVAEHGPELDADLEGQTVHPAPVVDGGDSDHGNITTADAGDLNAAARRYCASQGWAMADGSYPVRPKDNHGEADLDKAILAVGRGSGSHDAIREHITKRANALGLGDRIPEGWTKSSDSLDTAALVAALRSLKETE